MESADGQKHSCAAKSKDQKKIKEQKIKGEDTPARARYQIFN